MKNSIRPLRRARVLACALLSAVLTLPLASRADTAANLHEAMGVGINYGNHFEAKDQKTAEDMPVIPREKFRTLKAHGFNHVRLPVCWGWRLKQPWAGANTPVEIDDLFMSRVKQSVDNALAENLVVILNTHHEDWFQRHYSKENNARIRLNSTGTDYYAATEANGGRPAMEIYKDIWRDIIANFDGATAYERVVFEGLNEPRITDGSGIGSFTSEQVNTVNQTVFNLLQDNLNAGNRRVYMMTVNDANNARSFKQLVIPTRAGWANADVKAQLIVTIHYYHTYDWTHAETANPASWGSAADYAELTDRFGDITPDSSAKFANGSGALVDVKVNIGEFGVRHRRGEGNSLETNRDPAEILEWYRVVAAAAEKRGMTYTVWCDNGWFRVFNRADGPAGSFDWGANYQSEIWKMATLFRNRWHLISGLNSGWGLAASGANAWQAWEIKAFSAADALQKFRFEVDPGDKIASLEEELRIPSLRNVGAGRLLDVATDTSPANGRQIRSRDDTLDGNLDHYASPDYAGSGAFALAMPLSPAPASGRWVVDLPDPVAPGSDAVLWQFETTSANSQRWILERAAE